MTDVVSRPPHYTMGKIEVIDFLEDQNFNYRIGNAVKYISRYRWKGKPIEDLKKAIWYIQREIQALEENEKHAQVTELDGLDGGSIYVIPDGSCVRTPGSDESWRNQSNATISQSNAGKISSSYSEQHNVLRKP